MLGLACIRLQRLLHRDQQQLSESDRLALEEHLSRCEQCEHQARMLRGIVGLSSIAPDRPLSQSSYERIIARSFLVADREEESNQRPLARRWLWAGGLAMTAAAAVTLWVAVDRQGPGGGASVAVATLVEVDRVVEGRLMMGELTLGADAEVPEATPLRALEPATVAVGRATVAMAKNTTVSWNSSRRDLRVAGGAVEVELERDQRESFSVTTAYFRVEVLGSRFRVAEDSVTVHEGSVRVFSNSGEVLAGELAAGGTWKRTVELEGDGNQRRGDPPKRQLTEFAEVLLAQARVDLADGDIAGAKKGAMGALKSNPTRPQMAEARTILAEATQAAGKPRAAVKLYLAVYRRYGDLLVGETALFAAARLEANAGQVGAATRWFETYLSRYPQGRMREEATRRLRALSTQ